MLPQLDYNVIATGLIAPVSILIVKNLLDLSLGRKLVKYLHWLPVRSIFRDNPQHLAGKWEQTWTASKSAKFSKDTDRHSYTEIKQLGSYLYAEFDSKGTTYCLFAKIKGSYLSGEWYDKKDPHAYFGTLQFRIAGNTELHGLYIGHSHTTGEVGSDNWTWKRCQA